MNFGQNAVLQRIISRRRGRPFRYFNYLGVCLMASLTPDSCSKRSAGRGKWQEKHWKMPSHPYACGLKKLRANPMCGFQAIVIAGRSREIGLRVAHKSVILMRVIKLQTAAVGFQFRIRIAGSQSSKSVGSRRPIKCN